MKPFRPLFVAVAGLLVIPALLAACTATSSSPTATTASGGQTTTGTTTSGGGAGETIKIVSSLPLTGSSLGQTQTIVNGFKMALEENNNKAGNFTIVYESKDDATAAAGKWTPEAEQANAQAALNDKDVMVYLGTFNSGAAAVSIPILNQAGLVMISPANTAPELTKKGFDDKTYNSLYPKTPKNYFRVVTADDIQGAAAAAWAKSLGVKSAYILNDQEVYGKGIANVFEATAKKIGIDVKGNEGIDAKAPDYKALMNKIKGTNPDLVYFGGLTQTNGAQLLKDMKGVGLTAKFMGPDGINEKAFIEAAGSDIAEGTYATTAGTPYSKLTGKGKEFYDNYKKKYNSEPEPYAIYGYEAMKVALKAIEKAGKKDRAAILKAVSETKDYDGALGKWSFDANGDTTLTTMTGYQVQGGKWVDVITDLKAPS